ILRSGVRLAGSVALFLSFYVPSDGADHRDGPRITDIPPAAALDLNDLYIFRSPGNPSNTVLIFTVSPFAGDLTPETFDSSTRYDLRIDQDLDHVPDLAFRAAFSPVRDSSANGQALHIPSRSADPGF